MTATSIFERDADEQDVPFWPEENRRSDKVLDLLSHWQAILTFGAVALCVIFVFRELQPSQIFKKTTPAGGDMGAHVWLPAYVKHSLLSHFRLTGWTPDWYDGFPALTFYFPGPIVGIAVLSYIIPYDIAFKLVTILGMVSLPVAAWAFGRLARFRFPGPACLAVATLPFLFTEDFTIYGGNIASTMAGEFSFSIALSISLVFLGVVIRGLDTGKHRALAALLLAAVGVCHVLPLLFALSATVVLTAMYWDRKRLVWSVPVFAVGGGLIAFWALPFVLGLKYGTDMRYEKVTSYLGTLFPTKDYWLITVAGIGLILGLVRRNRLAPFLGIMVIWSALVFRVGWPLAHLWNARVIPFWYLGLFLLAGIAVTEAGGLIVSSVARFEMRDVGMVPALVVTFIASFAIVGYPLGVLPFEHTTKSGEKTWLGITANASSFIKDWVRWNYSGYEDIGKVRGPEYRAVVAAMQKLGADPAHGCGQAMWEYEPEFDQMGTPDAFMLLPYWTRGCIGSMEGLYYESSGTTPYHFLNVAELSDKPSDPVRGLTYASSPNVAQGVKHLQMLGVKYFMAITPDVEKAADADSSLQLVSTVGPFSVSYNDPKPATLKRTWKIYQISDSEKVAQLLYQPVVVTGVDANRAWLKESEGWYLDQSRWPVVEAASGPKEWERVKPGGHVTSTVALPPVHVSNIHQGTETISFNVDQTGVPVVVRESYFPNWHVSGAKGPYRVTPNLMVVIPTANHVTLSYGYATVDWLGFLLTLLALGGLVVLWRAKPVAYGPGRFRLSNDDLGLPDGAAAKVRGAMGSLSPDRLDKVFKAYDVRGTVPDQLGTDLAFALGVAFARFAGAERVLVARDMRPSGVELTAAFAQGVTSIGVDVVDLGMTSTDELYFAAGHLNAPGAMWTASHNPAQYNGVKFCLSGARPVGVETGLREIRSQVEAIGRDGHLAAPVQGVVTSGGVLEEYVAKVRSFVDLGSLRPLKVIADTANGMGGLVVPAVFDGLPFDLEVLFAELDGTFPNHPADPIQPENLVALQERIRATGADVGLAFDGDADRCFLVDDEGEPVSGSTTTALVAVAMLEKHPGATILHNLICSKAVPQIIRERGGTPVRTRVGHSYIKSVMADTDALFGGEHSGHYYFRDNFRADSGTIAALVVLEVLSKTGRKLSDLRTDFERYADSGEINTTVSDPGDVIDSVAAHYAGAAPTARQDRLDGLTVDFGEWWFNLRPSNTEPLLRLNLEAADKSACAARTAEVLALIEAYSGRGGFVGSGGRGGFVGDGDRVAGDRVAESKPAAPEDSKEDR